MSAELVRCVLASMFSKSVLKTHGNVLPTDGVLNLLAVLAKKVQIMTQKLRGWAL